ncbi:MAG: Bacterial regulatory protein luxR family, partial [Planctomycetota bacterium]
PPALPRPEVRVVPHHLVHEAREAASSNGMHLLSARERQVAIQLARGMSRPEVARELGVSVNTVATISKRIYAKLGVRRRAELPSRLLGIPA